MNHRSKVTFVIIPERMHSLRWLTLSALTPWSFLFLRVCAHTCTHIYTHTHAHRHAQACTHTLSLSLPLSLYCGIFCNLKHSYSTARAAAMNVKRDKDFRRFPGQGSKKRFLLLEMQKCTLTYWCDGLPIRAAGDGTIPASTLDLSVDCPGASRGPVLHTSTL